MSLRPGAGRIDESNNLFDQSRIYLNSNDNWPLLEIRMDRCCPCNYNPAVAVPHIKTDTMTNSYPLFYNVLLPAWSLACGFGLVSVEWRESVSNESAWRPWTCLPFWLLVVGSTSKSSAYSTIKNSQWHESVEWRESVLNGVRQSLRPSCAGWMDTED